MTRTLWFVVYHLLLAAGVLSLQTGCTQLGAGKGNPLAGPLPWQKAKERDPLAGDPLREANRDPQEASTAVAKGMNLERSGQLDKARETYELILKENPKHPEALHRLAVVGDKQRRHKEAQDNYLEAIKLQPRNAELFNDLGYSFYLSHQPEKAESALVKATQLEPKSARYRNNLALVIGQQGRIQEAFEQFGQAGSEADAHYNVAFLYASQNQPQQAKLCFQRALAKDPGHEKASKALESFEAFEKNGGLPLDEEFTADGRRLVKYIESPDGKPDFVAMNMISHQVDARIPEAHNIPQNRQAGAATRTLHNDARVQQSMASARE
jgi:tetratricopeptide (TPR) repeat protein